MGESTLSEQHRSEVESLLSAIEEHGWSVETVEDVEPSAPMVGNEFGVFVTLRVSY